MAKKMSCAIIKDGYTFDAETDKGETYPQVKFKFRPFTHEERMEWLDAEESAGDSYKKKMEIQLKILESNVIEWDAQYMTADGKYQTAEINEENLRCLPQPAFSLMVAIVVGGRACTAKQREKDRIEEMKEKQSLLAHQLYFRQEAESKLRPTVTNQLEEQEKN